MLRIAYNFSKYSPIKPLAVTYYFQISPSLLIITNRSHGSNHDVRPLSDAFYRLQVIKDGRVIDEIDKSKRVKLGGSGGDFKNSKKLHFDIEEIKQN